MAAIILASVDTGAGRCTVISNKIEGGEGEHGINGSYSNRSWLICPYMLKQRQRGLIY